MPSSTESTAVVVTREGEGARVLWFADEIEIKRQDGIDVLEMLVHAGTEPPLHVHEREEESFYVLEGRVTFFTETGELDAPPGTYVNLPRGVAHTYAVDSGTARLLVTAAPSGFATMFSEFADRLGSEPPAAPTPEHIPIIGELAAAYGITILGPNPRYA